MTDADAILKLIESADPNDSAALDEIDARVWVYVVEPCLKFSHFDGCHPHYFCERGKGPYKLGGSGSKAPRYTRSRDALKSIRPKEWLFDVYRETFEDKWNCKIWTTGQEFDEKYPSLARKLPTEELAELHAIIQAIQHERGQS